MKEHNLPSNKNFGIVFFLFFILLSIFLYFKNISIILIIISFSLSIFFLILGLLQSKILTPLNKIWFRFGMILGSIISPLIMGIIFFLVVTPIGLVMRVLRKDVLNLKYNDNKTYWIEKKGPKSIMKNQF